jgi:hypothetical protein
MENSTDGLQRSHCPEQQVLPNETAVATVKNRLPISSASYQQGTCNIFTQGPKSLRYNDIVNPYQTNLQIQLFSDACSLYAI